MISLITITLLSFLCLGWSYTDISVYNDFKDDLNIKISGAGVGGCDVIVESGSQNLQDCDCLWGTVGYKFKAYVYDPILTKVVYEI